MQRFIRNIFIISFFYKSRSIFVMVYLNTPSDKCQIIVVQNRTLEFKDGVKNHNLVFEISYKFYIISCLFHIQAKEMDKNEWAHRLFTCSYSCSDYEDEVIYDWGLLNDILMEGANVYLVFMQSNIIQMKYGKLPFKSKCNVDIFI